MKTLKELFRTKDQRIITYLGLMLLLGVLLMLLSGPFFRRQSHQENAVIAEGSDNAPLLPTAPQTTYTYERILEIRLEEALSLVEGVGQVRVLVTFATGRETVFAVDRNTSVSVTQEQDAQGGTRYQSNQQNQDNTLIITDRTGVDRPIVVTETPPIIGGVVIIAEGGDDILVRDALIRATSTLLGIEIHRVQVMRMKDNN
ncbi:MAG: hypothetical protein FWC91_05800 [Defluviitaleaceae bacterium]|nr:hypothetical protein [Defluviitaleaceae bacterium]